MARLGPNPGRADMSKKSLTDEAVTNVSWQAALLGSRLVLKAVILIVLARNIPPAEFGLIAAATVITSLATDFSQFGVHRALVQRLTLTRAHIRSAFAISLITGVIAAIGILAAAPWFTAFFRMEGVEVFIRFLSFTLLFAGIAAVSASMLQRERRFRDLGLAEFGSYLLGFGFVALPMAFAGFGAWALAAGFMTQAVSRTIAVFVLYPPAIAMWPSIAEARELLRTGIGFSVGQIGNFVATQVDYVIAGRYLGAEALGFYNRAYQFLLLPAQVFGTVTSTVLFPTLSSIQDQPERVARAYLRTMGVIALLTLPVGGVLAVIAPELVLFLLGEQWTGMIAPFQILVVTLLFRTGYKISDAVTLATGSMYRRALRHWIYAAAVAAGAYFGLPYGLAGVATGVGAAVVLNHVLMMDLARQVTGISFASVARVQLRHVPGAAALIGPLWLAVELARGAQLGTLAVLAVAAATGLTTLAVLWFGLRKIFGAEGAWLHDMAAARLGKFFKRSRGAAAD